LAAKASASLSTSYRLSLGTVAIPQHPTESKQWLLDRGAELELQGFRGVEFLLTPQRQAM